MNRRFRERMAQLEERKERIEWVMSLSERDYTEAKSAVEDIQESGDYPEGDE